MSRQIINGRYDFQLLPTQRKMFECAGALRTPNICYCGGFGSGKSRLIGELGWEFGINYPGIEVAYFRKTRVSITDTTYKDFIDDVVPPEYIAKHNKSSLEVYLKNRSYYHFFGIDNFSRKGSLKFDIIFVDEGIELTMDDIIMLQGRLRGKTIRTPLLIFVTNAGAPGMPLYEMFVKQTLKKEADQDKDFAYFTTTSFENTFNPPAYFQRLEKWKGTIYYDRYVLSRWKAFEGLVYGMFDPDIHVIDPFEIPRDWLKTVVIDFGYTIEHPMVINWYADNPITGITYLYRQLYLTNTLVRDAVHFAMRVTEAAGEKVTECICDWDAENRAQVDEMWMETTAANKSVDLGIQSVVEALLERPTDGARGFYVFNDKWAERPGFQYGCFQRDVLLQEKNLPTCFQEETSKYRWGRDNKPVKDFDHSCDATRYKVHTHKVRMIGVLPGSILVGTTIGAPMRSRR